MPDDDATENPTGDSPGPTDTSATDEGDGTDRPSDATDSGPDDATSPDETDGDSDGDTDGDSDSDGKGEEKASDADAGPEGFDVAAAEKRLKGVEGKIEEGRRALDDLEQEIEPEPDDPPAAEGGGAADAPPG